MQLLVITVLMKADTYGTWTLLRKSTQQAVLSMHQSGNEVTLLIISCIEKK